MRFRLEGAKARHERLTNWHRKFALLPVLGGDDEEICWLEYVERRGTFKSWPGDSYWDWEYRRISA